MAYSENSSAWQPPGKVTIHIGAISITIAIPSRTAETAASSRQRASNGRFTAMHPANGNGQGRPVNGA
jgi:hypothetical protein